MRWTRHAEDRVAEMRLRHSEVVAVLMRPEAGYPSPARYGPGPAVITVLWRGREAR